MNVQDRIERLGQSTGLVGSPLPINSLRAQQPDAGQRDRDGDSDQNPSGSIASKHSPKSWDAKKGHGKEEHDSAKRGPMPRLHGSIMHPATTDDTDR